MFHEVDIKQFIAIISTLAENKVIHYELAEKAIQIITLQQETTLLTRQQAARFLNCSTRTIDRLCDEGKLTKIRYSKRTVRICLFELQAMIEI